MLEGPNCVRQSLIRPTWAVERARIDISRHLFPDLQSVSPSKEAVNQAVSGKDSPRSMTIRSPYRLFDLIMFFTIKSAGIKPVYWVVELTI
jgi:hypothetical protein